MHLNTNVSTESTLDTKKKRKLGIVTRKYKCVKMGVACRICSDSVLNIVLAELLMHCIDVWE